MRRNDRLRCALSIAAAAGTVLICLHQRHFTLTLADPHSFVVMTTHRCGLVMLAFTAWMTIECIALCLPPAQHESQETAELGQQG